MQIALPSAYMLRNGKEEDINGIISINSLTLPEHYTTSFYYSILSTNPDTFLVVEYHGKIVGYHMGRIEHSFSLKSLPQFAKKGHIISIAVFEEHRRTGLGKALIEKASEEFLKNGCEVSFLEVRVSNELAISLYKNCGFRISESLREYYSDGEDAYVMEKKLV